ncbi:MAG: trypsin-like peptidase domain-containing protein, partial [Candidatus Wildermuthbacteria bacterium]|nr:trypsin-like peptidase domain-containing protein [Candidatus Wildermuthbacteria bacterium]
FIVSRDGLLITNKHVVLDTNADYTVFLNDGTSYSAKVLARDPVQDLAVLKIDGKEDFPFARFGNSDSIQSGQTVIAIGNALGEFRNTVSVGVISGLGRTITASGGNNFTETIEDVIQTDAAINKGNSGGPLLNLAGQVIGINTATVIDAQSISFAIPSNKAIRDLEQVQEAGEIVYPFLGVRYALVTEALQEEKDLPVDYGAFIEKGPEGDSAIIKGSAADKAGIKEGDIILEFNGEKVTPDNPLGKLIQKRKPNDAVSVLIYRNGNELELQATLGKR